MDPRSPLPFMEKGKDVSARDSSEGMRVIWALPRDPGRAKGDKMWDDGGPEGNAGLRGDDVNEAERGILRKLGPASSSDAAVREPEGSDLYSLGDGMLADAVRE